MLYTKVDGSGDGVCLLNVTPYNRMDAMEVRTGFIMRVRANTIRNENK